MRNIGVILWLIFGIALLGWYGFAMVGAGIVLYIIGFIIKCKYDDYKDEKRRMSEDYEGDASISRKRDTRR